MRRRAFCGLVISAASAPPLALEVSVFNDFNLSASAREAALKRKFARLRATLEAMPHSGERVGAYPYDRNRAAARAGARDRAQVRALAKAEAQARAA